MLRRLVLIDVVVRGSGDADNRSGCIGRDEFDADKLYTMNHHHGDVDGRLHQNVVIDVFSAHARTYRTGSGR